ncbi:MAG: cytochrome c maturation protein CcmE [Rickettsiales bacterium]
MKPKHQRLLFIACSVLMLCAATLITLQAFNENIVFFYSPSDLESKEALPDQLIRVGGLVLTGSVSEKKDNEVSFSITDGKATILVSYQGLLPSLFREGQGIIAEGYLQDRTHIRAKRILAKHDEKYVPKEVMDSLKKTGHWKEGDSTP